MPMDEEDWQRFYQAGIIAAEVRARLLNLRQFNRCSNTIIAVIGPEYSATMDVHHPAELEEGVKRGWIREAS